MPMKKCNSDLQIRKRTPIKDYKGLIFQCKVCIKRYMSYPAWYLHMKQKHSHEKRSLINSDPRIPTIQKRDPRTKSFFECPRIKGGPIDPLSKF